MNEPLTITIEVDRAGDLAYFRLSHRPVARTEEFDDSILVDLDEYDMVVGMEFLDLQSAVASRAEGRPSGDAARQERR